MKPKLDVTGAGANADWVKPNEGCLLGMKPGDDRIRLVVEISTPMEVTIHDRELVTVYGLEKEALRGLAGWCGYQKPVRRTLDREGRQG